MDYISILPKEVSKKKILLKELGVNTFDWKYNDLLQVLDILEARGNIYILGGDVYNYLNRKISFAYDVWSKKDSKKDNGFDITRKYLKNYFERNGNDYVYAIVVVNVDELNDLYNEDYINKKKCLKSKINSYRRKIEFSEIIGKRVCSNIYYYSDDQYKILYSTYDDGQVCNLEMYNNMGIEKFAFYCKLIRYIIINIFKNKR